MPNSSHALSRRTFLQASAAGIAGVGAGAEQARAGEPSATPRSRPPARTDKPKRRLAVVTTAYYYLSHAYHICGRFLHGYLRNGRFHYPDWAIASMYVAQPKHPGDLSAELARRHKFPLYRDISGALTLGGDKLAVDAVLLIAEHGDYPYNDRGQKLYPRFEMFNQIAAVFRKTGRSVPVFCDKHLSYDRKHGFAMVETARKLKIPLMAGSSLPITWRRPELELPPGARVREALVASRGELEIYGIHALEALQCMIERRTRGQQGVRAVQCLEGDAVWKAGDSGVWSWELLEHALGRSPSRNVGDVQTNCRHFAPPPGRPTFPRGPVAFVVEYRDGLRATALSLNGHVDDTTFAARVEGEKRPVSTMFYLPPPPGAAFLEALTVRIEDFLASGRPPYPVERTLLTGGILDAVLESRVKGHRRLETPELDVSYDPPKDSGFLRGDYTAPV
ncbi:MAG: twin-arginine translocation signal domain-containing protein [Gemmataceae bacterium]|nr:twin-arginine translocation signal domain-containing protein [Gemmataceae bacterium]